MFEKEIRGEAVPDPHLYIPEKGDEPQAGQGGGDGNVPVATSGPGYAFTPEQLHSLSKKWDSLAEKCHDAKRWAELIRNAEPPGVEYASVNTTNKIKQTGDAIWDALDERHKYCNDMAEKLRAAAGSYRVADDEATASVEREGKYR